MNIYTVQEGDNVDAIAQENGIPVETLVWANQIEYPYRLAVGQALFLPGESTGTGLDDSGNSPGTSSGGLPKTLSETPKRTGRNLYSFGYAYPFINARTLNQTLPYLTDLYVFSYGFTEEGNLVYPNSDDRWMVAAAKEAGVRPVLTLTPLGADGHFNNNLVSVLVRNPSVQQRLIWELGRAMQERGFLGLNIDFEYVLAEDRQGFAGFVRKTREVMNLFDYEVSVALAPKTSAGQKGLLYEGMDYRLLGEAANHVMLMTYEWGYSLGPPMAVAPLNMVRRVVEYALSEIPAQKISLGIPNYGYDWPLPYERGITRAQTINYAEAVQTAIDHGVEIWFDPTAKSPYYRYWQYGILHEVWYEDVKSVQGKFSLIQEYGLLGAGYWQLMNFFRANWLLMEEEFVILRK